MKRLGLIAAILLAAGPAFGQISGSAHDFSGAAWVDNSRICVACHIPHNADTTVLEAPLWNHQLTSQNFTPYSTATIDANPIPGQPGGISRLCLSCHDGSVQIDDYFTNPNAPATTIANRANVGTDLSDDHPIGFQYDNQTFVDDGELYDPDNDLSGLPGGGTIAADMLFGGNNMECASCHDVHNTVSGAAGTPFLLLRPIANSTLCLTCHNK